MKRRTFLAFLGLGMATATLTPGQMIAEASTPKLWSGFAPSSPFDYGVDFDWFAIYDGKVLVFDTYRDKELIARQVCRMKRYEGSTKTLESVAWT